MRNIIEIKDFSAPELDDYARLTENQLVNRADPAHGRFIAESPNVISRALDGGCRPISFLMEQRYVEGQGRFLLERCPNVPVYTAQLPILEQITGYRLTRGVLCAMYRPPRPSMEELCTNAHRVAVLEEVMNPTNVGAIFRSAAALGMDAVLLTPGCSDPLYRRAARVSMGTVFQIPWTYVGSDWHERLHRMGFQTAAMALCDTSRPLYEPLPASVTRLAVVLGTEGDGLATETIDHCDFTLRIPMSNGVDSLNVAAASAVAFWQLGIMSERKWEDDKNH